MPKLWRHSLIVLWGVCLQPVKGGVRTGLWLIAGLLCMGASMRGATVVVKVTPATATLTTSQSMTFKASVTGTINTSVNWSVRTSGGGTISSAGVYRAPITPGTYRIRATSRVRSSAYAEASVNVLAPPNAAITAASSVTAETSGLMASVAAVPGSTYLWSIQGGAISSGTTENQVVYAAGTSTSLVLKCTVTNAAGTAATGSKTVTVVGAPKVTHFAVSKPLVTVGTSVVLTPVFENGSATISEVGAVSSGVGYTVLPKAQTTYVLTVSNALGAKATATVTVDVVAPARILSFMPAKDLVTAGRSTMLTGVFEGGAGTISNLGAVNSGVGRSSGNLEATTTFTLVVVNAAGDSVSQTVKVDVVPMPVILGFAADQATITEGAGTFLTATFTGGTATIDPGLGSIVSGQKIHTGTVNATTLYGLTISNPAGDTVTGTCQVTVVPPPRIISFLASNTMLFPGEIAQVYPVFSGGSGLLSTGQTVNSGDAVNVAPSMDTVVTLTVTNAAGSKIASSVSLQVETQPVRIDAFTATPVAVDMGSSSVLEWAVTGRPSSLMLNGESVLGDIAIRNVQPIRRQTYTLSGSNPNGGDAKTVTVIARGLELYAGSVSESGALDGNLATSRFYMPSGLVFDQQGHVIVADTNNHTIRKLTPAGIITTLAGTAGQLGSSDGLGSAARFLLPNYLTVDASGTVFVTDSSDHTIRKITPAGQVTTFAGGHGQSGSNDGTLTTARFFMPAGLAFDPSGNLWVADGANWTIRRISPAGQVTTVAGYPGVRGTNDGVGSAARFWAPGGIAVDAAGNAYVTDKGNHTIRKITPNGTVTTLAGAPGVSGFADGVGSQARFYQPYDLVIDSQGVLFVADTYNQCIRKVLPDGTVTTVIGVKNGSSVIPGAFPASIGYPIHLAISDQGDLLITSGHGILLATAP